METLLYLAHTEADGSLSKTALEALGAAASLASDLGAGFSVGLIGEDVTQAANAIGGCGAEKFFAVSGPDFGQSRYSTDTAAAVALIQAASATLVLAPATSRLARSLPGAAQRAGGRADTQVTALAVDSGSVVATRWYYRQRMFSNMTRSQRPWVITLSPGCFPAWEGEAGSPSVEAVSADAATNTTVKGVLAPSADEQTIRPDAEMLFVAGAGWTKKQADGQTNVGGAEDLILGFLDQAKASLGSSKSLVDLGGEGQEVLSFLSHLHQVGQTGSTPRHAKGLATCCHGEEPHVVGWRFITERRAVNLDEGCGWAQGKADVLYVADAFEVMTKVNELLGS